jgi:(4S)-4-hydroxy-5-phosphonooxypentane-2,3-dione isomerase
MILACKEGISMYVACVHVQVKSEHLEAFIAASRDNASNTIKEPGNLRFDVLQQADDPQHFILYEVYRDEAASKAHKLTAHYARWREAVEPWMDQPRKGVIYGTRFPPREEQWETIQ